MSTPTQGETRTRHFLKCTQCRRHRKKCTPSSRPWPGTRCDRCELYNYPCSELLHATDDTSSSQAQQPPVMVWDTNSLISPSTEAFGAPDESGHIINTEGATSSLAVRREVPTGPHPFTTTHKAHWAQHPMRLDLFNVSDSREGLSRAVLPSAIEAPGYEGLDKDHVVGLSGLTPAEASEHQSSSSTNQRQTKDTFGESEHLINCENRDRAEDYMKDLYSGKGGDDDGTCDDPVSEAAEDSDMPPSIDN